MVCRLVRPQTKAEGGVAGTFDVAWNPETGELGGAAVGAEAVINLGGASIADGRWTDSRKKLLRTSRVEATRGRGGGLRIDVWAEEGSDLEVWSAQQKSDLLAEVSGGPVRFRLRAAR